MSSQSPHSAQGSQYEHIRRCHRCGELNSLSSSAVTQCGNCGKAFAPFFYFSEADLQGLTDRDLHLSLAKFAREVQPIWGLSTYWEIESSND